MNATAARIFSALDSAHPNATTTAAAIGMSKQAYSIARQRVSLSDDAAIRAAALLRLDPAETLAALHRDSATTPETRAAWESVLQRMANIPEPGAVRTPQTNNARTTQPEDQTPSDLYYVKSDNVAYPDNDKINHVRSIARKRIEEAETLAKWMLCVPKISPTSPRFVYYADNWNVLDKIRRFSESGELAAIIKECPAFSPAELRAALDYLDNKKAAEKPHQSKQAPAARQSLSA